MRRRTGIVIGACAALALAATAGAVASGSAGEQPAGVWHEASAVERTPVSARGKATAAPSGKPDRAARPETTAPTGTDPSVPGRSAGRESAGRGSAGRGSATGKPTDEKATAGAGTPRKGQDARLESAATSRQRVGELLRVEKLLGYLAGPQTETFRYPGASYVKVHFDRMAMAPGDHVTVSNPEKTESYRYDAPAAVDTGGADRWAMSITGDTAVVEVHRAADPLGLGAALGSLGVHVDRVARGYTRTEQRREKAGRAGPGREESVCGVDSSTDAVCYRSADPVAYTKSKAIARLLINGTELCTGWRVGAKNRMITNNHCLTSSEEAYDTEVWFNYQCATCGGYDVFKPTKVWGDKVLATDKVLDFTLFSVDGFASVEKFGYLTLDTVRPIKGQELYVPQHPAGEPTRIAGGQGDKAGNCAVEDPAYTGYAAQSDVSYYCDTAGGSSGSPVLSRATNRVVALHHFGGCPNSGVRGDLLAAKLRTYL
ncbi:trypsin-like serine peptidase [Actinoplanes rectilineatus]|uniref:trypsin-like serine peptidase n=1 Tax=Actinoplanes rectilineatus TaxID=113571 RepID=UPI0005F2C572|nr:serine protease [Actinoplanes rectilineatus]